MMLPPLNELSKDPTSQQHRGMTTAISHPTPTPDL